MLDHICTREYLATMVVSKEGPNLWATLCGYFGSKVHTQRKRCQSGFGWLVRHQMVFRSTRSEICSVPSPQRNCATTGSSACSIEYWCPKASKDPASTAKFAVFPRGHWADIWPEANWTDGFCTWSGGSTWLGAGAGWSSGSGLGLGSFRHTFWCFHHTFWCFHHTRNMHDPNKSSPTTATITGICTPSLWGACPARWTVCPTFFKGSPSCSWEGSWEGSCWTTERISACGRSECASKCWSLVVKDSFQSTERIRPSIKWSVWSTTIIYKTSPGVKVLFMDLRLNYSTTFYQVLRFSCHVPPSKPSPAGRHKESTETWPCGCEAENGDSPPSYCHLVGKIWEHNFPKARNHYPFLLWWPMVQLCSWSFCFHVTPKPTCSTEPRRAVRVLQQVLFSMQACIAHIFEIAQLQEMAGGCTITPLRGVSNQARGSCQHWLYHHVCLSPDQLFPTFVCGHLKQRQERPQHNLPTIWTWQWIPSGS